MLAVVSCEYYRIVYVNDSVARAEQCHAPFFPYSYSWSMILGKNRSTIEVCSPRWLVGVKFYPTNPHCGKVIAAPIQALRVRFLTPSGLTVRNLILLTR
jgi:hypothetical protein